MSRKFSFLLVTILLLSFWPLRQYAQYDETGNLITFEAEGRSPIVYRLTNGLTVILYADRSVPQVTGMVVALAGGKDDLPDATGMAHYMEHMLFKGTSKIGTVDWSAESKHISKIFQLYDSLGNTQDEEQRKALQKLINEESLKANEYAIPNELDRILKEMGSTGINAGTGPDYTVFYNTFPPHQMEKWLEVYSHRFLAPVFRSFQSELEVVYEEKNMYSDMFFMNLFEAFNKKFYRVHPYGQQPLIGTVEHLKNPSLTKMKAFYDRWYVANNMGLIITGDFDPAEVMPWIQQKFGMLPTAPLPEKISWVESPFNGREFVEEKLSPIKIGLLGYRIPPSGHPDKLVLEVIAQILTNSNGTGLLDKLSIDNKLLQAACMNVQYEDYGTGLVFFIPKIVGQSLEEAEKLVTEQMAKLRKGDFSDTLLESIKLNMYKEKTMALESTPNIAYALLDVFANGGQYQEIWDIPNRVRDISKDEVMRVAMEYFGDNYLAFYSKTGFPKKPKIEKPGYEPVKSKQEAVSGYYRMINEMDTKEPRYSFVDFNRDIQRNESDRGFKLYRVENTENDIFTCTFRFGIGEGHMPILSYVSQMMNLAGAGELTVDEFKLRMAMLGCTYSVSSNDSYLTISLDGPEENLGKAMALLGMLVQKPVLDQKKLTTLYSGERANRKLERSEPDMVADALVEYVLYGEESSYLNRLTMKQIKALQADTVVAAFLKATQYAAEIHYVGKRSLDEVSGIVAENLKLSETPLPSTAPFYRKPKVYAENGVYITPKKKASQSKIFFHAALEDFNPNDLALYTAFNTYFGGDFSGIVLQEIREYRSMAYSAGGAVVQPPLKGNRMLLKGFVGTQSDKTNEAIDVYVDLVRNMPRKPNRMTMIQRYITSATVTQRPDFRNLSQTYVNWVYKGFEEDPAAIVLKNIETLSPSAVFDYQKVYLKEAPLTIMVAGNAKKFDKKAFEKHGKVTIIKEKKLFSK